MPSVGNCAQCGRAVDDTADRVVIVANRFQYLAKNTKLPGFPIAQSAGIYRIGWKSDIHYHVGCCPAQYLPAIGI
jgi:hypothetical protein